MAVVGQRVVDLVGVVGERRRQAAGRLEVGEVDRAIVVAARGPGIPHPHERVLQHRQLIGIVAHVVQESLHEHRRDLRPADADRLLDRVPLLIAQQPGNQVLAFVHRFGQAGNLGTVAQIVGTHRDGDVDRAFRLLAGGQEQVHERGGRFLGIHALLPEAEQLLELIDHDQQVGARLEQLALFHRFDQAEAAAVERGEQPRQGAGIFPIVEIGLDEGPREVLDGAAAGPENHHLPGRAGLGHGAAVQLGDHAGPHQRRLAAARGADDRQESVRSQQLQRAPQSAPRGRRTGGARRCETGAGRETDW